MKMRAGYKLLAAIIVSCCASSDSFAQAFGITGGTSTGQLNIVYQHSPGSFMIDPPVKHPAFDEYMALSTPETGVCRVTGIGKTIKDDAFGEKTRNEFESISNQLSSRYGNSKKFDFLKSGSIWHEDREWTMSVLKDERSLTRYWLARLNSKLPSGLKSIVLKVRALDSSRAYVNVSYEFSNIDRCLSLLAASDASKL